jgi:hypothetical protein
MQQEPAGEDIQVNDLEYHDAVCAACLVSVEPDGFLPLSKSISLRPRLLQRTVHSGVAAGSFTLSMMLTAIAANAQNPIDLCPWRQLAHRHGEISPIQ